MARKQDYSDEEVFQALNEWLAEHGTPPTIEELREKLGVGSTRTALRYLQRLEALGKIERWTGARGIRVLAAPEPTVRTKLIPVVGDVAAGSLTFAEENVDAWVRIPEQMLRPTHEKHFLLRVRGDSMNRAKIDGQRIESGDLLLVRQQQTAKNNDVVVAEFDGETTIKRFQRGQGFAVLKPESDSPKYKSIMIDREFRIQGIVMRVFKNGVELIN